MKLSTYKRMCIFFLLFITSWITANSHEEPNTSLSLLLPTQSIKPGTQVEGIIQFSIDPGWHLYWKNPGEAGLAPSFTWDLPPGISVNKILWPSPSKYSSGAMTIYGYEGTPSWIVSLSVNEDVQNGTYPISLSSFWLNCNGSCVPGTQTISSTLKISQSAQKEYTFTALDKAKTKIPSSIQNVSTYIQNDFLIISIPTDSKPKKAVIFPEQTGLFPLEKEPSFLQENGHLKLRISITKAGQELLETTSQFEGLVQLIFSNNEKTTYEISSPLSKAIVPQLPSQILPLPKQSTSIGIILLFAFVGGLILNLTPCALPVVGIRILQILSSKDEEDQRPFLHGLSYTMGILVCFWILATILYSLEYLGSTIGWGFQLQEPRFVAALIIILFILSLSLFGVYEIGTSLSSWTPQRPKKRSLFVSFSAGLLATIVATPCTGPLLGSVFGFAATFHPIQGILLFTTIGLGMAFPFLVISLFPSLVRWIPKPGPWMVGLKQFFGFLVVATIIWLVWVLEGLVDTLSVTTLSIGFFLLSISSWIYGRWNAPVRLKTTRFIAKSISLVLITVGIGGFFLSFNSGLSSWLQHHLPLSHQIEWQKYSEQLLDENLREDHIVFVKFTAKWCLTCQTNRLTFMLPNITKSFQKYSVVPLSADWTDGDPKITEKLRSLGRNGVPVNAIFRRGHEPVILPELITPESIEDALLTMSI